MKPLPLLLVLTAAVNVLAQDTLPPLQRTSTVSSLDGETQPILYWAPETAVSLVTPAINRPEFDPQAPHFLTEQAETIEPGKQQVIFLTRKTNFILEPTIRNEQIDRTRLYSWWNNIVRLYFQSYRTSAMFLPNVAHFKQTLSRNSIFLEALKSV